MGERTGAAFAIPTPEESSRRGQELAARYLLGEVLGEGGMATVHRATDRATAAEVAVKIMHPRLTLDRDFALRFKREGLIARRLAHPGIVRVLDHGVDGHLYFLVMELLDGEDIASVLAKRKRLEEGLARRVVIEICEALGEAHAQGIVHRDLKPENVFLCRAEGGGLRVRVLDFGIAKMLLPEERGADEAEQVFTAMGALLGTPEYLSPEMCRGEPVGPAADLYACGVILYALLAGRPPFVTKDPMHVTLKHVGEEPLPPSWFVPGLDPGLDALVLRALAKQPEDHHPSAAALADALRALGPAPPLPASLLGGPPTPRHAPEAPTLAVPAASAEAQRPDDPPSPISRAAETQRTRRAPAPRIAWAALAAVLVGLAFLAGVVVGRATAPEPSAPSAPR